MPVCGAGGTSPLAKGPQGKGRWGAEADRGAPACCRAHIPTGLPFHEERDCLHRDTPDRGAFAARKRRALRGTGARVVLTPRKGGQNAPEFQVEDQADLDGSPRGADGGRDYETSEGVEAESRRSSSLLEGVGHYRHRTSEQEEGRRCGPKTASPSNQEEPVDRTAL